MDSVLQKRIQSIDVVRGLIMALMALDHTRDFFHIDAMIDEPTNMDTTTPFLFFTRWITHFCAPIFVFLSGVSIYLQSLRKTKKELAGFLFTRGLWLVIAELTFIGFGWSFNIHFDFFVLQVIWAIGCSMIILSGLIFFRYCVLAALGIIITIAHNLMDTVSFSDPTQDLIANLFIITEFDRFTIGENIRFLTAYAILPWTGIMLLGYTAGKLYSSKFTAEMRKKTLLIAGSTLILAFIILRTINSYGDPEPWEEQRSLTYTLLSFLNVTKYPPSLMYSCMTLGPALVLLASIENVRNRFTDILNIFGRVPFFYYILHIYIIHLLCIPLYFIQGFTLADLSSIKMSFGFRPVADFGFSIGVTYIVWIFVLVLCYFPSRWYNNYKSTHKQWWLSYI